MPQTIPNTALTSPQTSPSLLSLLSVSSTVQRRRLCLQQSCLYSRPPSTFRQHKTVTITTNQTSLISQTSSALDGCNCRPSRTVLFLISWPHVSSPSVWSLSEGIVQCQRPERDHIGVDCRRHRGFSQWRPSSLRTVRLGPGQPFQLSGTSPSKRTETRIVINKLRFTQKRRISLTLIEPGSRVMRMRGFQVCVKHEWWHRTDKSEDPDCRR